MAAVTCPLTPRQRDTRLNYFSRQRYDMPNDTERSAGWLCTALNTAKQRHYDSTQRIKCLAHLSEVGLCPQGATPPPGPNSPPLRFGTHAHHCACATLARVVYDGYGNGTSSLYGCFYEVIEFIRMTLSDLKCLCG